jgi:hypothetical protein
MGREGRGGSLIGQAFDDHHTARKGQCTIVKGNARVHTKQKAANMLSSKGEAHSACQGICGRHFACSTDSSVCQNCFVNYCTSSVHLLFHPPGALNDYQKDLQFRKLNAQKDVIEVKVVRGGQTMLVKNHEVVVGDLVILDTGGSVLLGLRDCWGCCFLVAVPRSVQRRKTWE